MIDRRSFICVAASGLVALPAPAVAQQAAQIARIGYLRRTAREPADIAALRLGLAELGYVEGQNLVIEERYANGDAARLPELARELMQQKVQVFVVDGGTTVGAVREIIGATPLVFTLVSNPVRAGWARSLAHPGGNITGLSNFAAELEPKRLQLLRELVPAKRIGVLDNPTNRSPTGRSTLTRLADTARTLGIELTLVEVSTAAELSGAFAKLSQSGVGPLLVMNDALFFSQRARMVELASTYRLPVVYPEREFVDAGGLMAYAPSNAANFRRAAIYVDKILKGAKPGDLAIEQPTKIELVINLKTAKALGLTIPQALLLRADEVIQ